MSGENGDEVVTKVYDPPWGTIAPLQLENGRAIIPPGYTESLRRAMAEISDTPTFACASWATPETRRSIVEPRVCMATISVSPPRGRSGRWRRSGSRCSSRRKQAEHEGRGYVQSPDVVNRGFTQGETSYVVVQVVYDELAVRDDYEGVDITRLTRELTPKSQYGINLMHISVDGKPIDDPDRSSADVQRCTDVALEKANIQFQFDNLKSRPRLGVTAAPKVVTVQPLGQRTSSPIRCTSKCTRTTPRSSRAEVRIFDADESVLGTQRLLHVDPDGIAEWRPDRAYVPRRASSSSTFCARWVRTANSTTRMPSRCG